MSLGGRSDQARRAESEREREPLISLRAFVFLLVSIGIGVILVVAGAPIEAVIGTPVAVLLALVQLVGT